MVKDDENINPHDLVKKHIENKGHNISDEELEHLKIGADAMPEKELKKEIDQKEEELKPTTHLPNPFDVL